MHNANLYESANELQKRDTVCLLQEFSRKLSWQQKSELVLDVGCGSGDVTSLVLAPTVANNAGGGADVSVVGVDVSQEMVQYARTKFGSSRPRANSNNISNRGSSSSNTGSSSSSSSSTQQISFSKLDISKPIPKTTVTRKFSKIFSFYCLHWVKDQNVALNNMHRLMEDEGEGLLVFLAKNPLFDAYRRQARKDEWRQYMEDVESFVPCHQDYTDPASSFSLQLSSQGFEVLHCEARSLAYAFDNVNQLVAAVKAVNPFLARIPQELQGKYVLDLLGELKSSQVAETGKHEARYTLMISHIRKPSSQNVIKNSAVLDNVNSPVSMMSY